MNTVICVHLIFRRITQAPAVNCHREHWCVLFVAFYICVCGGDPERRETWYNRPQEITYLNISAERNLWTNSSYGITLRSALKLQHPVRYHTYAHTSSKSYTYTTILSLRHCYTLLYSHSHSLYHLSTT